MSTVSERASVNSFRPRIVTDEEVERALTWLRDNAVEIGAAKAQVRRKEALVQSTEAILTAMSDAKSADARKMEARANPKWMEAIEEECAAIAEFEKLRALREAAALKIDAWRSEQANYRGMKI